MTTRGGFLCLYLLRPCSHYAKRVLLLTVIVAALAVARLARLVAEDEITVGLRQWVVKRFGANGYLSRLVHCAPWCMSMWFAVIMPFAVLFPNRWLLAALSIPAGSMLAALILNHVDRES